MPQRIPPAEEQSTLGKIFRFLGTGERIGTELLLMPMLEASNPQAAAELRKRELDIYAQDVVNAAFPDAPPALRTGLGLSSGIVVDPLSYLGFGGLTKAGKAARIVSPKAVAGLGQITRERNLAKLGLGGTALQIRSALNVPRDVAAKAFKDADLLENLLKKQTVTVSREVAGASRRMKALGFASPGAVPLPEGQTVSAWDYFRNLGQFTKTPQLASEEAAKGLKGLVRFGGISLGEGVGGRVGEVLRGAPLYKAKEVFTTGKLLEIPAVKSVDQFLWGFPGFFLRSFDDVFGTTIVTPPWIRQLKNNALAELMGVRRGTVGRVAREYGVHLDEFVEDAATWFPHMSRDEIRERINTIVNRYRERVPGFMAVDLQKGSKTFGQVISKGLRNEHKDRLSILRESIADLLPGPAELGGHSSPWESVAEKRIRKLAAQQNQLYKDVLREEGEHLSRQYSLVGSGLYTKHAASAEGRREIEHNSGVFRLLTPRLVPKGKKFGRKALRSREHTSAVFTEAELSNRIRSMRIVRDDLVGELARDYGELFDGRTVRALTSKSSKGLINQRSMNTFEELTKTIGNPTKKQLKRFPFLADPDVQEELFRRLNGAVHNLSIEEANAFIYRHGIGRPGAWIVRPKMVKNFFSQDTDRLVTGRLLDFDRAMVSRQFFEEAKGHGLSVKDPNLPPGWLEVPDIPELEGFAFHPEAARQIRNLAFLDVNINRHVGNVVKMFDKAQQWWKAWTLAPFMPYHVRNFVGNMNNIALEHIHTPTDLLDFTKAMKEADQVFRAELKGQTYKIRDAVHGIDYTANQLVQDGIDVNLFGSGFISAEQRDSLSRALREARIQAHRERRYARLAGHVDPEDEILRTMKRHKPDLLRWANMVPPGEEYKLLHKLVGESAWPVDLGFRVGAAVEDRSKMALLIFNLKRGMSPEEAITNVKKLLFDYHQLTDVEKGVFKRVFPFYTWSRKNIPLQLEYLIKRPGYFTNINRGIRAGQELVPSALGGTGRGVPPADERHLSEWMIRNYPARVRRNKEGRYEYFMFRNWLPAVDLEDVFHLWETSKSMLSPLLKVPVEQMLNTHFLTGRNIDVLYDNVLKSFTKGERERFMKVFRPPKRVTHVAKQIRLLNQVDQWLTNPQELDIWSQVGKTVVGRTYPLHTARTRHHLARQLEEMKIDSRRALRSAYYGKLPPSERSRLIQRTVEERRRLQRQLARGAGS